MRINLSRYRFWCAVLAGIVCALTPQFSLAQEVWRPQGELHPVAPDTAIHYGVLPNGLTYYISRQEIDNAEFRLLQRTGSLVEEKDEKGMAHFVEHMVVNGSKHFPDRGAQKYLESIGVRFGTDVNAFTTMDYTMFLLSEVPDLTEGRIDSCLRILLDWSHHATFTPAVVERERGVIQDELRQSLFGEYLGAMQTLQAGFFGETAYRYPPIGSEESIRQCTPGALERFYRRWFQPQLQAIVVVGNVDVKKVEARIRALFGGIPRGESAWSYPPLPHHDTPRVLIQEQPGEALLSFSLLQALPRYSMEYQQSKEYLWQENAYEEMNERLGEHLKALSDTTPGIQTTVATYDHSLLYTGAARSQTTQINCKTENWKQSFRRFFEVLERARRYGLGNRDDSAVDSVLFDTVDMESCPAEEDDSVEIMDDGEMDSFWWSATAVASACAGHFLEGKPLPSSVAISSIQKEKKVTPEERDSLFRATYTDRDLTFVVFVPKGMAENAPTQEEILTLYREVRADASLDSLKLKTASPVSEIDTVKTAKGKDKYAFPAPGTLLSEHKTAFKNVTEWRLSNGVRVVLIPEKEENYSIQAFRRGGMTFFENREVSNASLLAGFLEHGSYDADKMEATTAFEMEEDYEKMSLPVFEDWEAALAQFHYDLVNTEVDSAKVAPVIEMIEGARERVAMNPNMQFLTFLHQARQASMARMPFYMGNEREELTVENLRKIQRRFRANNNGLTVFLRGKMKKRKMLPLVLKYLGSLPSEQDSCRVVPRAEDAFKTESDVLKVKITERQPMAFCHVEYLNDKDFRDPTENKLAMDLLSCIVEERIVQHLRFEKQMVYSAGVTGDVGHYPQPYGSLTFTFSCAPEKRLAIQQSICEVLQDMEKGNISFNKDVADKLEDEEGVPYLAYEDLEERIFDAYLFGASQPTEGRKWNKENAAAFLQKFLQDFLAHARVYTTIYSTEE